MKKVFIDTSVLVRFITADDEKKYHHCLTLIQRVEEGKIRPYISHIIVLELIFVLEKLYKFPRKKVLDAIDRLLEMRHVTVINKVDFRMALKLTKTNGIKYSDCLIATQVAQDMILCTYDKEFGRISSLQTKTPEALVA